MIDTTFARDLVVIGAIFGIAAFAWAGWGQEGPPRGWWWRALLVVLQVAGLALAAGSIVVALGHPDAPTALASGSSALVAFIVVFWLEVAFIVGFAIFFRRTRRAHLIAPTVLIVVGVHFAPLAVVLQQPLLWGAAIVLTVAGVAALLAPGRAARSFWSAVFSAPMFLVMGGVALAQGHAALSL